MNYIRLKYMAIKYLEKQSTEDNLHEYEKAFHLHKYIKENYPLLDEALNIKTGIETKEQSKENVFSVIMYYFCLLNEPMVAEKFKKLVDSEVSLANQILKNEPEWFYLSNYNFINPGTYSNDSDETNQKESGYFSELSFSKEKYEVTSNRHIDVNESCRFYLKYRELLIQLHRVILEKDRLLEQIYTKENPDNYMDLEVLKIIAKELGVNYELGGLEFLVKNNKKPFITSKIIQIRNKIKGLIS